MKNILLVCILMGVVACKEAPKEIQTPSAVPQEQSLPRTGESSQPKLLVSKGIIRSDREVKVFSTMEGQLLDVKLLEGERVREGQVLFKLDSAELVGKVALSLSEFEQANLRMEEILIGQGYKRESLDKVPEDILRYARIKSGVNVRKTELQQNRNLLGRTVIRATQRGVITGIEALSYDFVKPGKTLCTIVDPDHLIVEFSILETELRRFEVGTRIDVRSIAFVDVPHEATVRSIGSVVDGEGMIKVEAVIADTRDLMPGMTAIINL